MSVSLACYNPRYHCAYENSGIISQRDFPCQLDPLQPESLTLALKYGHTGVAVYGCKQKYNHINKFKFLFFWSCDRRKHILYSLGCGHTTFYYSSAFSFIAETEILTGIVNFFHKQQVHASSCSQSTRLPCRSLQMESRSPWGCA